MKGLLETLLPRGRGERKKEASLGEALPSMESGPLATNLSIFGGRLVSSRPLSEGEVHITGPSPRNTVILGLGSLLR